MITQDHYQKCLDNIQNYYCEYKITEFDDSEDSFTLIDENGLLYYVHFTNILYKSDIHPFHRNSRYSSYNFSIVLKMTSEKLAIISGEYINNKSNFEVKCLDCGKVFYINLYNIENPYNHSCESEHSPKKRIPNTKTKTNNGSIRFGDMYPELLAEWDYSQNGNPTCGAYSKKRVSWICSVCEYKWSTQLRNRTYGNSGCPKCSREKKDSKIQTAVYNYMSSLGFTVLRESEINLKPINPKTNRRMFYDNEVVEIKLIVEVHGKQHYDNKNGIHLFESKRKNITKDEAYQEMLYRDDYKEVFCLENGYYYLAISYLDVETGNYKQILKDKIKEIYLINP